MSTSSRPRPGVTPGAPLDPVGIVDCAPEHLIAAADPEDVCASVGCGLNIRVPGVLAESVQIATG